MNRNKVFFKSLSVLTLGILALIGLLIHPQGVSLAATATPPRIANGLLEMVPSVTTIKAGDSFDLTIQITIDSPTCGAQSGMTFDPKLVEVTGVDEGDFYKKYADANNLSTALIPATVDNATGILPYTGVSILGKPCGPTGTGSLMVLHMKAKANGQARFSLTDIIVGDDGNTTHNGPVAYAGINTRDLTIDIGGTGGVQTQPTRGADIPTPIGNSLPTQAATAVVLPPESPSGPSIPWAYILPGAGLLAIVVVVLTTRKKK